MNNDELQGKIKESGYKLIYIASRLNISRSTLYRKLKGYKEFTELELKILYGILGVDDDV